MNTTPSQSEDMQNMDGEGYEVFVRNTLMEDEKQYKIMEQLSRTFGIRKYSFNKLYGNGVRGTFHT